MKIRTVAILSPGDMGHSIGKYLRHQGFDVITFLDGRSNRTRNLAKIAGFRIVKSMESLVETSDVILSILVPSMAKNVAQEVAKAIQSTAANSLFVDCNAISPQHSKDIQLIIEESGGCYVDGGIIGNSPDNGDTPRIYVSGLKSDSLEQLSCKDVIVKSIGQEIGQASGLKMCYAALTKGTNTLHVALLLAAEKMGLMEQLIDEFEFSQTNHLNVMKRGITKLPSNSHRWIGEMEEISSTFNDLGVTPYFHMGAKVIYELLNASSFGEETPETIDYNRTSWNTIKTISKM